MSKGLIGELENKKNIVLKAGDLNLSIDNAYKQGVVCGLDFAIKLTKSTIDDILGELDDEIDILKGLLDKTDYFEKQNIKLIVGALEKARQIITSKMGGADE